MKSIERTLTLKQVAHASRLRGLANDYLSAGVA
jgi:hypothetical protein